MKERVVINTGSFLPFSRPLAVDIDPARMRSLFAGSCLKKAASALVGRRRGFGWERRVRGSGEAISRCFHAYAC